MKPMTSETKDDKFRNERTGQKGYVGPPLTLPDSLSKPN